jgi:tetratricopeptide (TPR) repeat protein
VIQPTNDRTTPELPDSATKGGKMGGTAFKASRELGLLRVPASWLLAFLLAAGGTPAFAQEQAPACAPVIARVVSLQGTVEVQRAGTANWLGIRRLDTSICAGDRLRTAPSSRAALFVQPETLVRVDQNTTITLQQSTDEISVEFSKDEVSHVARNAQSCGAGYFITRFPKRFRVTTPHLNAAVEGTEFMVESSCEASQVTVLEGRVLSQVAATQELRSLTAGQQVTAAPGTPTAFSTVIKPADAVQWVLRYPPLSDAGATGNRAGLARAEASLQAGRVDEALQEIGAALGSNPGDANALALRSIIQVAKNDQVAAMESARAAAAAEPGNYRGWLALSYAQQASFELEAALESAQRAQSLNVDSSLLYARVAELQLSLGNREAAERAARAAVNANPSESTAHTIMGYVNLAAIETKAARADFTTAIEGDSFNPMPRLGLGLAMIREGHLTQGREQLEIAVALDPRNSLLRSYVGKAYYEERTNKRGELASSQLDIAKTLDPNDPTPWLYEAIRLQSINRPVEAASALHESIALNDNRAVFRSRLLLDSDLAARNAGLGGVYRNLGFEQLALIQGYQSLRADPSDYTSHRLLADHYDSLPRHEIARVNELFKSQLLQPLNATPIPAQAGQASLFLSPTVGPSSVSFNEFTQLFTRDQLRIQASGVVGGNDTIGNDLTVAGIRNRFSFNLGQYHFETDGFRENNDSKQDVLNAYFQYALSGDTSALAELRTTKTEQGDLNLLFDPTTFDPSFRQDEDTDSLRLGIRHDLSNRSQLLGSILFQDADIETSFDPGFEFADEFQGYTTELQHIYRADGWNLVSGIRYIDLEQDTTQTVPGFVLDPPVEGSVTTTRSFAIKDVTGYAYADIELAAGFELTVGAGATSSQGRAFKADQVNPKFGITWQPSADITVRASAFRTLQPTSFSRSNIQPFLEPTEVTGFNQYFFGTEGEDVWRYGIAFDQQATANIAVGLELSSRNIETPIVFIGPPEESFVLETDEISGHGYIFWTPAIVANVALRAEYEYDEQDNEELPAFGSTIQIRTHRVPLGFRCYWPNGLGVDVVGTYVDQQGDFLVFIPDPPSVAEEAAGDAFWVFDASVSYRLPHRYGLVTLGARNLFDERFKFQDVDPANPRIFPERIVELNFIVDFVF